MTSLSTERDSVSPTLPLLLQEILDLMDAVVTGDEVARGKPAWPGFLNGLALKPLARCGEWLPAAGPTSSKKLREDLVRTAESVSCLALSEGRVLFRMSASPRPDMSKRTMPMPGLRIRLWVLLVGRRSLLCCQWGRSQKSAPPTSTQAQQILDGRALQAAGCLTAALPDPRQGRQQIGTCCTGCSVAGVFGLIVVYTKFEASVCGLCGELRVIMQASQKSPRGQSPNFSSLYALRMPFCMTLLMLLLLASLPRLQLHCGNGTLRFRVSDLSRLCEPCAVRIHRV